MAFTNVLHCAVQDGHAVDVERALLAGADLDVMDMYGQTALIKAIQLGHLTIVDKLLIAGADVNRVGSTCNALRHAIESGYTTIVHKLLVAGARGDPSDMIMAVGYGHSEIVRLLIQAGWPVDATGLTSEAPLACAANEGHVEVVEALVTAGANVNHIDSYGPPGCYCAWSFPGCLTARSCRRQHLREE